MKNTKRFLTLAMVVVSMLAISISAMAYSTMYVVIGPGSTVRLRNNRT